MERRDIDTETETKKEAYEAPNLEVIEFELKDSIAASGDLGPDAICGGEFL